MEELYLERKSDAEIISDTVAVPIEDGSLLEDDLYGILNMKEEDSEDFWAEAIVSPRVHHNVLTSEIRIPIGPALNSTSLTLTSLGLQSLENSTGITHGSKNEEKITTVIESFPSNECKSNEEVRCPQDFDTVQIHTSEIAPPPFVRSYEDVNVNRNEQVTHQVTPRPLMSPRPMSPNASVEDDDPDADNTVVVSNLQEVVIQKNLKNKATNFGFSTMIQNPLPPVTATCVKYKVHQCPNGVTTISIDPKAEPVTLNTPLPIIHHVINLPPRRIQSIRNRRRKLSEESGPVSYDRSTRLSQLMLSDYKIRVDRPPSSLNLSNVSTGGHAPSTGFVKGNMESMKRKVGSWYRRRVKTPVEQLSIDLGLDTVKFPIKLPSFKCGSNRVNARSNFDQVDGSSLEIDDLDETGTIPPTDQRFVEGLACDQGQNEFEELRRVVKQGGDFCKDLAAVLQERSELEGSYAKGLTKLSAKLLKASKEATGSVAHAWQAVAVQIDTQAELHRIWSTALLEEVAKPLRNSTETQHKIRKSVEVLVEKTTRNLAEWRIAEAKAKRQTFSSSKEFEKIQENVSTPATPPPPLVTNNGLASNAGTLANLSTTNLHNQPNSVLAEVRARSRVLSLPPPDKDPIKLEAKRRKAEESVRRADIEYYTFSVRSERARLEWEGAIRNGSTCLRTLEEEKLGLLKDLASKYYQHFNDFIPKLLRSSECLEEPIKTSSVEQDMHSVVDIRRHAGSEQLLPDFYAEDISNLMNKERRIEALQKFLSVIKQDLERERRGASGLLEVLSLTRGSSDTVRDPLVKYDTTHYDPSDRLYYVKAMLLYLEGTKTKVENALRMVADQDGRPRLHAPIMQYMRHQRDKQGLPQTILKVPTWARDECLNFNSLSSSGADSGSGGSVSPDWRVKEVRPDVTSNGHVHDIDFDEFSSQGSACEDVFDETISSPSPPIENGAKVKSPPPTPSTTDLPAVSIPSIAPSIGQCRVIYDYDSNMFDELTIRTGEILNVHDKQDDGWWLGELNGQVGIFPATYVEEIL